MRTMWQKSSVVRAIVLTVCLGLATSCGDDDGDDGLVSGTGEAAAASYDGLTRLLFEGLCAGYVSCCGAEVGLSVAECVESEMASLQDQDADRAAIAAGRVRIDVEAARSCAAQLRAANCDSEDVIFDAEGPCSRIRFGNVPLGDTCLAEGECVDGVCAFDGETDPAGTCTRVDGGDACPLTCFTEDDGEGTCYETCPGDLSCEDGICVVEELEPGLGEPCDFNCEGYAWCNENNVCEAARPAGAPCDDDQVCESYECVNERCAEVEYCF